MRNFSTRHLNIPVRELTIGGALRLNQIKFHEEQVSEFIRETCDHDPWAMTIEERMFYVCHHIASLSDEANFHVGERRFADYLQADKQEGHGILNGKAVELLEKLQLAFEDMPARSFWVLGIIAATTAEWDTEEDLMKAINDLKAKPISELQPMIDDLERKKAESFHLMDWSIGENGGIVSVTEDAADAACFRISAFIPRSLAAGIA